MIDRKKIATILPEIIKIRHTLHQYPELSHEEFKTAALVAEKLTAWGYSPMTEIAKTGVTAILDSGKPGKTVALRADMDALPIQEATSLDYASNHAGKMHACGHDGHTATLLLAAYLLRHCQFSGKIKFIFQPAEEVGLGADAMIKAGVLNDPAVDAIFGYHNIPTFPKNKIIIRQPCIFAGASRFKISIKGTGGHSSSPEKTIDPIYIGSSIVQAIQSIVSRSMPPSESVVISVTQFHAGQADNVIPNTALLHGTLRFAKNNILPSIKDKMIQIVSGIATTLGGEASIDFVHTVPATMNTPAETHLVKETAAALWGQDSVVDLEHNLMVTEDFSFYLNQIPGCYFIVGTGVDKQYIHHPEYAFDDDIIPVVAELLATTALKYLEQF